MCLRNSHYHGLLLWYYFTKYLIILYSFRILKMYHWKLSISEKNLLLNGLLEVDAYGHEYLSMINHQSWSVFAKQWTALPAPPPIRGGGGHKGQLETLDPFSMLVILSFSSGIVIKWTLKNSELDHFCKPILVLSSSWSS